MNIEKIEKELKEDIRYNILSFMNKLGRACENNLYECIFRKTNSWIYFNAVERIDNYIVSCLKENHKIPENF